MSAQPSSRPCTPGGARRRAAVVATAVAASALALPVLAQPASASVAVAGVNQLVAADTDNDGFSGIYRRSADNGNTLEAVVPETATRDNYDLSVSADGSRFAYATSTYDATDNLVGEQISVRDLSGNLIRVVDSVTASTSDDDISAPAMSPDGNEVSWSRVLIGPTSNKIVTRRAPAAAGAAVTVPGSDGLYGPVYVSPTTVLATNFNGDAFTLPAVGSSTGPKAVTGLETGADDFTVSTAGDLLAWSTFTRTTSNNFSVKVASLSVASDGTATVGATRATTVVGAGPDDESPAFSADGSKLSFVRSNGAGGPGDVVTSDITTTPPGTPVADPATADDEYEVGIGAADAVAPGASTMLPAVLSGTSATIRWTLPSDADASGVQLTRTGGATKTPVFAVGSSYVDTGLAVGTTYTYTVQTLDRSGNAAATTSSRQLVATAPPTFAVADPTSRASTTAPFRVTYNALDKAGTSFSVAYRNVARSSSFTTPTTTTAASTLFGYAGKPVTVTPGDVYEFRGSARDTFGNTTGTAVGRTRAVVPYDQTRATFVSTAGTVKASYRWLGTSRVLFKAGQIANLTGVYGNRLQIVGDRSTSGGSFALYLKNSNGTYSKLGSTVSTYASSSSARQVLYSYAFTTAASRTYQIRWVAGSTSTRRNVVLDAFAVRR